MKTSRLSARIAGPVLLAVLSITAVGNAQDPGQATAPDRWLLLCSGLPGDDVHRERLTEACQNIMAGAQTLLNIPPEQMQILAGDVEMREALAGGANEVGVCTEETVAEAMRELSEKVSPDAGCWIVILGHAQLYASSSQFNVLGPDFDQEQFAAWAMPLACREQVFLLTMPISGFWIKPLAAKSRVIISATEADLEFTGTEMPYALGDLLVGQGEHQNLEDIDRDGSLSLLDLYLAVNLEIHGRFKAIDRLQTEHAQLDDNGDGRGSELQQPYLPVEDEEPSEDTEETNDEDTVEDEKTAQENKATESKKPANVRHELPKPVNNPVLDGFRSRHIPLSND